MDLLDNPFNILNATPRDNEDRLTELFEERSLMLDPNLCSRALSDLTNTRRRLACEVAWMPGMAPKQAENMLNKLENSPSDLLSIDSYNPMGKCNLLAAGLDRLSDELDSDDAVNWILALAESFEDIDPEELQADINGDRTVAGIREVNDQSYVEFEIQERRRTFLKAMNSLLERRSDDEVVYIINSVVDFATDNGEEHGPLLIDDIVNSYEIRFHEFLEDKAEEIEDLSEEIKTAADGDELDSHLYSMVEQLIQVVKNWDSVAQPIQVSTKSRGLEHEISHHVAASVRELAIHLFNKHDRLDIARQLNNLLQDAFAEVGKIAEKSTEDDKILEEFYEHRKLDELLGPIFSLCKDAIEKADNKPALADREVQRIFNTIPELLARLEKANPPDDILSTVKDEIAMTLMSCSVTYCNTTKKWKLCVSYLDEALKYASNPEAKSRIEKNLSIVKENARLYSDLKPISSAPSLNTINGIGFTLYGSSDHDEQTQSYLATYYFVFFAIPVIPICRYRVVPTHGGYKFLGKAPLRTFDKCHLGISLALIAAIVFSIWSPVNTDRGTSATSYSSTSSASTSYNENDAGGQNTNSFVYPTAPENSTPDGRLSLKKRVEDGKARAAQMETEITVMDERLKSYQSRMDSLEAAGLVDAYNDLVDPFNALIAKRKALIDEYNELVAEINSNVRLYNSGNR